MILRRDESSASNIHADVLARETVTERWSISHAQIHCAEEPNDENGVSSHPLNPISIKQ